MAETIYWIIIGVLILSYLLDQLLNYLSDKGWDYPLPDFIQSAYSKEKYLKAKAYHQTSYRLSLIKNTLSLIILLVILKYKGFGLLDDWVRGHSDSATLQMLLFFGVLFFASDILSIPFQWYSTFTIEERYGFNKTTPTTFLIDKVKSWLIASIIGGVLLVIIFKIYEWSQDYFWLLAWGVISAFSLFMAFFYTKLLLPIFNKLSPLEDGELKEEINKMAIDTGFTLDKIFVMDGSKRSSKANAFFSGLGKQKSIILYDTLIEQHTNEELLAVLAHEIGHYKLKHIPKSIILGLLQSLFTFYVLGLFLKYPVFTEAIGFNQPSFYASLISFGLLYTPIEIILGSLSNIYSRKNEYEADAFANEMNLGGALMHALIKMSAHHLSNLYPHSIDIFINYSHPTLLQRISNLKTDKNEPISTST
jgi:STE24 endopeptidase